MTRVQRDSEGQRAGLGGGLAEARWNARDNSWVLAQTTESEKVHSPKWEQPNWPSTGEWIQPHDGLLPGDKKERTDRCHDVDEPHARDAG